MRDSIDEDLANALARLETAFRALADTRDSVGRSLDLALTELTRQLAELDAVDAEPGDRSRLAHLSERHAA